MAFLSHHLSLAHLVERIMTNALKHRVVALCIDLCDLFICAGSFHKFFGISKAADIHSAALLMSSTCME